MTALATGKIKKTKPSTIFQRLAAKDRTAVTDCVENYGSFIWALARKFTASPEEAEAAAQEIFNDIWRYAERGEENEFAENLLIALIARRRLIQYIG